MKLMTNATNWSKVMPRIRTIEEDFEYQMKQCLRQFIKNFELKPDNGDELFKAIWENRKEFGTAVYEQMGVWMDEDEWLDLIKENN